MRWGSPQQDPNCSPLYLDHGDTLPGAGELPKELPKEVMGVSAGSVHPLRYLLVPSHPTPLLAAGRGICLPAPPHELLYL